jgi:hypothetical protein
MKLSRAAAWVCGFLFWGTMPFVQAAESKSAWQAEWDAAVEAAKKDGQISIYHTRGPFENVFTEFSKRYSGIKVVSVTGRGGELISRIMAERRAGRYGADVYLGATGTPHRPKRFCFKNSLYRVLYNLRMENLCIRCQMCVNVFQLRNMYGAGLGRIITLTGCYLIE